MTEFWFSLCNWIPGIIEWFSRCYSKQWNMYFKVSLILPRFCTKSFGNTCYCNFLLHLNLLQYSKKLLEIKGYDPANITINFNKTTSILLGAAKYQELISRSFLKSLCWTMLAVTIKLFRFFRMPLKLSRTSEYTDQLKQPVQKIKVFGKDQSFLWQYTTLKCLEPLKGM